jgi:two-component system, LuxR family, sensor kinase FixL
MTEHLETTTTAIDSLNRETVERERIENELRCSEERFRILFEYAPDAYFLHDLQGRLLDVNKRAEQLTGYGREEQIGRTIIDLGAVPPSETDRVLSMAAENAAGRPSGPTEVILRHKDGALVTVEVMTLPIRIKGDPVVLGIARDITERILAEARLRQQTEVLRNVINNIPHFVFWKDRDSVYLGCNEVFAKSAGLENPGEIIGKTDYDLVWKKNADSYRQYDRQVMESGEPLLNFDEGQTREDGRQIALLTSKVPLRDTSGKVVGILGIYNDITKRKQAEKQQTQLLQQLSEINQELKDFAHIVSHDLKAPLRAIRVLGDWLCADYADKLDDQGREYLTLLASRVDRMQGLIDGVLQYSRIGRTEQGTAPVDLGRLLPEIIENLSVPEHITIQVEPDLPTVEADVTRITQVFQNLLSNAIKYLDKPQGHIIVACVAEEGFWEFRVSDNGPGIEPKHFDRIFKLFQTLAARDTRESTGVGLTITKKIVEMYGGKIWVESEVGHGSTFFFTFPKKKEADVPACVAAGVPCR